MLLGHGDTSAARVAAGQGGGTGERSGNRDRWGVRAVGRRLMVLLYNGRGAVVLGGNGTRPASGCGRQRVMAARLAFSACWPGRGIDALGSRRGRALANFGIGHLPLG